MKHIRKCLWLLLIPVAAVILYLLLPRMTPAERFGFSREVSYAERELRMSVVDTACSWAGVRDDDGSHRFLIDLYNTLDPLPQEYRVTYDDAWCAAFGTAAAMEAGLTDIIPPECSCSRQIRLFQDLASWVEEDAYVSLPGDYIYYDWDLPRSFECTGWPEHVGVVVGTYGPFLRVMEGNKQGVADYRTLWLNDWCIRGYGTPDYASKLP